MPVYVLGDVHGHAETLRRLVDRLDLGPEDVMIQLGDCINRGPHSFEVVEFWLHFDRCPYYVLGGNHEEMMFDFLSEGSDSLLQYGGVSTIESYQRHGWTCARGAPDSVPAEHFQFYLQALPWTRSLLVTSWYIFTHAGYDFSLDARSQNPQTVRWGRITGWRKGMPTAVRGHTPQRAVRIRPGVIEVDTGCGLGGPLSCIVLPEERVLTEWPEQSTGG